MSKIKVSVIIPAYNAEKYIKMTIESIINQTLKEIEIIIINDGSTDNTLSIINELEKKDDRIIIINNENKGVSYSRNVGIKKSRGEYLAFIDADDWIEKNYLEEVYDMAEKKQFDMVLSDIYIDYLKKKKQKYEIEGNNLENMSGEEYLELYYSNKIIRGICNKLIKRKIFKDNDLFFLENVPSGEDLNITLKLGFLVNKIGKINKAYYHYIQHSQSTTKQKMSNKIYPYLLAFEELNNWIKDKGIKKYDYHKKNIYLYEMNSLESFIVRDSDWKNVEYIEAVKKILELIQKENSDICIERFKNTYKILWKICKKYPKIKIIRLLNFLFGWIYTIKEKLYRIIYL